MCAPITARRGIIAATRATGPLSVLAVVLAGLLVASSCSFVAVKKAPENARPGDDLTCTTSRTPGWGDLGIAAFLTILGVNTLVDNASDPAVNESGASLGGILLLTMGSGWLASGTYGIHHANRCRMLQQGLDPDAPEPGLARPGTGDPRPGAPPASREPDLDPTPTVTRGRDGGPCYGNRTCDQGLYCDPGRARCTPGNRGLAGGACFGDNSCTGDLLCEGGICMQSVPAECRTDDHCAGAQVCDSGTCVLPAGPSAL